jgi:hypothetical protein
LADWKKLTPESKKKYPDGLVSILDGLLTPIFLQELYNCKIDNMDLNPSEKLWKPE